MPAAKTKTRATSRADAYRRVPNINLFPAELRRRLVTSLGRTSIYILMVTAVVTIFLLMRQENLGSELTSGKLGLQAVQSQLALAAAERVEVEKVQQDVDRLEQGVKDYQALVGFTGWAVFLKEVQQQADVARVSLTSVKQIPGGAVLTGSSSNSTEAVAYLNAVKKGFNVLSDQTKLTSISLEAGAAKFYFTIEAKLEEKSPQ
ncbi:MAG: hypothetical protein Q7T05_03890 [Dehalococcoidia bacterium]|nr:hypothetical protein [Dehalococcoidia bacterium]